MWDDVKRSKKIKKMESMTLESQRRNEVAAGCGGGGTGVFLVEGTASQNYTHTKPLELHNVNVALYYMSTASEYS